MAKRLLDTRCPDCGGPRGKDGPRCPACLAKIRAMIAGGCIRECRDAKEPDPAAIRHTNGPGEINGRYNPNEATRLAQGFRMMQEYE